MAIALKKEVQKKGSLLDSNSNESPMQTIITRQSPDLFIGLCGFAGCGMKTVNSVLSKVAKSWNYDVVHIRISDLMQDPLYFEKKVIEENDDLNKERHIRMQKLANGLRRHYKKKELLAEAAITYIKSDKVKKEDKSVKTKTVYIIDQLKRPEEIEIKIRLTETEHQRLLDRCDRTHLAEWLRQLGLGEHTSRKRRVPDVAPELLRQVSGIGNNLNQIARRLNQADSLTPSERASLLVVLTSLDRQLGDLLEQNRDR
jgi:hypothetical protein